MRQRDRETEGQREQREHINTRTYQDQLSQLSHDAVAVDVTLLGSSSISSGGGGGRSSSSGGGGSCSDSCSGSNGGGGGGGQCGGWAATAATPSFAHHSIEWNDVGVDALLHELAL